jgi:uncharacterized protein (DUF58 family)
MRLTPRSGGLLGAGLGVLVFGVVLDQRDLLRVGLLLLLVPLLGLFLARRRREHLEVVRTLTPPQVQVGQDAVVTLSLRNVGRRPSGALRLTDTLDPILGPSPRLVVGRIEPGGRVTASYPVHATVRGHVEVGPLVLQLDDPFGLAEITRSSTGSRLLTVTPAVAPLRRTTRTVAHGGAADGTARRTSATGYDDVGTRAYRPGDELRRVHWRATARTGSLMVREEDEQWESHALVVLDTRTHAHRGDGRTVDTSSFEWAVHAAASVCVHLASHERRLRLVAGEHDVTVSNGETAPLLDVLAAVRTSPYASLVPPHVARELPSLVVAVLGSFASGDGVDPTAAHDLRSLRASGVTSLALAVDAGTWAAAGRPPTISSPAPSSQPEPELVHELRASGWRVGVARHGSAVADVWADAAPRGSVPRDSVPRQAAP